MIFDVLPRGSPVNVVTSVGNKWYVYASAFNMKNQKTHSDFHGLSICGTGRALPQQMVSAASLDQEYGLNEGFIASKTGVQTRYFCTSEDQIDLARDAAVLALADANIDATEIDLVISAAAVAYQSIPATAPLVQRALGIDGGSCFGVDVNATCLGFPAALQMADALLRTGQYCTALVVASERASRGLPWDKQPEVAGLFGDGAGAAVVRLAPDQGIRAAHFCTYPEAYDACRLGAGGTRFDFESDPEEFAAQSKFRMDGKQLFKLTSQHFSSFVDTLLTKASCTQNDISCVIAHQASPGALQHMIRACQFHEDQVINIAPEVGNQIAASIPFVLDTARRTGRINKGDRIALLGTSAGVSFGGLIVDV